MATLKRNHTPKNTMCICSACEAIATKKRARSR